MPKILLADDSNLVIQMVSNTLLSDKFTLFNVTKERLLIAKDGLEAFNLIAMHKDIEYLISDINMPHLNGDELIEILADTEKLGDIKVIFITTTEKKLTRHDNKAILGTITKPLNPQKIIDEFKVLLDRYNNFLLKGDDKSINTKKSYASLLWGAFVEYVKKIKIDPNKFLESEFEKSLLLYIESDSAINDTELIEIFIVLVAEYFMEKEIDITIDQKMLQFILKEHISGGSKEIAEFVFQVDCASIEIIDSDDEVVDYLNSVSSINIDLAPKGVIKKHFLPMITDMRMEEDAYSPKKARLDYIQTINYVYKFIEIIKEIDFTLISDTIKEYRYKLELFSFYYEEIKSMQSKYSNEDFFVSIFLKYQPSFIKSKALFDKYIKDPTNVSQKMKLGKYQEQTQNYSKRYKKEFSDLIKLFLKQNEQKAYLITGYYIKRIFTKLIEDGKKSKALVQFYIQNDLKGEISVRAFIPYYTHKNKLALEEKKRLEVTKKYLVGKSKKDIVVISTDMKDVSLIKKVSEHINPIWDIYGYNNINIIDSYFSRRAPDILIIEHQFKSTNTMLLINELRTRFSKFRRNTKVIVIFHKITVDAMQSDILDKDYQYLKKPLDANKLKKILTFI